MLWDHFSLLGPCSLGTLYVDITEKFTSLLSAENKAENFQQDRALPSYNSNVHSSWTQNEEGKAQSLPNLDELESIISVVNKIATPEMLR
jgi:Ca2+-dependent lipid-binding protein